MNAKEKAAIKAIKPHPQNPNFPFSYGMPKSLCGCGHSGDGPNSEHAPTDLGTPGHGKCDVKDCACVKFRWAEWHPFYKEVLKDLRSRQKR